MNDLIHAELLKLRTIRMFWWTIAATLAFDSDHDVALAVHEAHTTGGASLDSAEGFRNVMAAASSGGILMVVVGIAVMAGEFRFGTITSTFLITPDRRRVLGAKLAAASLVGIVVGVVASLLTLAIALPWLSSSSVELSAHVSDIAAVLLGATLSTAIGGVVGVGIGALLTNQTLAITVTLIWTLLVEAMVASFAPGAGRWFPGGTASAMSGVAPPSGDQPSDVGRGNRLRCVRPRIRGCRVALRPAS